MLFNSKRLAAAACLLPALGVAMLPCAGDAATVTSTFKARINIGAGCIISANPLDFGTAGVLAASVDATSTITVSCSAGTAFQLGLDKGAGTGASTALRYMTGGAGAKVGYRLFSDTSRSVNWGDVTGADTISGTGAGLPSIFTVYGRVPAQTTPAPGSFTDTITATVTY